MVSEENWRALWNEWQDKRQRLRGSLALLDQRCEPYIDDLDRANASKIREQLSKERVIKSRLEAFALQAEVSGMTLE